MGTVQLFQNQKVDTNITWVAGRKSLGKSASRKKPVSKSVKAGLQWPVRKTAAKKATGMKVSVKAAVMAAAANEYICAEIMELCGNAAKDNKRNTMKPRHLMLAIKNDEELNKLITGTIPQGGVLPNLHPALAKKK